MKNLAMCMMDMMRMLNSRVHIVTVYSDTPFSI